MKKISSLIALSLVSCTFVNAKITTSNDLKEIENGRIVRKRIATFKEGKVKYVKATDNNRNFQVGDIVKYKTDVYIIDKIENGSYSLLEFRGLNFKGEYKKIKNSGSHTTYIESVDESELIKQIPNLEDINRFDIVYTSSNKKHTVNLLFEDGTIDVGYGFIDNNDIVKHINIRPTLDENTPLKICQSGKITFPRAIEKRRYLDLEDVIIYKDKSRNAFKFIGLNGTSQIYHTNQTHNGAKQHHVTTSKDSTKYFLGHGSIASYLVSEGSFFEINNDGTARGEIQSPQTDFAILWSNEKELDFSNCSDF